jgi:hypothetical protein
MEFDFDLSELFPAESALDSSRLDLDGEAVRVGSDMLPKDAPRSLFHRDRIALVQQRVSQVNEDFE